MRYRHAFTLLEVMIAVAFIGIAMLALLSLHQSNLQSVIRGQDLTQASMLAQQLMSTAEVERFPMPAALKTQDGRPPRIWQGSAPRKQNSSRRPGPRASLQRLHRATGHRAMPLSESANS